MRGTPTGDDSPHWWRNTCETIKLQALVVYRYGARARLAATHAAWSAADAWLAATHAADDEQMLVMHALHAILEAAASRRDSRAAAPATHAPPHQHG